MSAAAVNPFASGPVLLTGGTGFIGSHVRRRLRSRGTPVRVLAHHADTDADELVRGDLGDPDSLRGICEGVTTLVHTASVINGSEEACRSVNERGTAALVAEARRAGVRRIVYVSTAAVYGQGVHRGITEDAVVPAPVSPTSRSRLKAEGSVLAVGGTVLRPMFVYGDGDRWFVPTVARLALRLGARPAGGRARLSLVSVDALAEAVCAVARLPTTGLDGAVLHATPPAPTALGEILDTLTEHGLLPPLTDEIDHDAALALLGDATARTLSLLDVDHYYDGGRLRRAVDLPPEAGFRETFARYAGWYEGVMATPSHD
ncbi:NAD-dependent epimerase/dehydratase family protein [Streptomyces sp. NPDC026672]|uniref:NAD-dependent epimerase/dehydratase family protein n=1 Tax=unclassified Streptomyces TaxID=2593676 RepID=UPI0034054FB3